MKVSLLSLGQVSVLEGGLLVVIDLSASKTDPQGRGFRRAHRCLCDAARDWVPICPACIAAAQVTLRRAEGASDLDPLFATCAGGDPAKASAVLTLRTLLAEEGPGKIDGHSMRRCGAKILTAAGVEPWLVEWFGRWGSSAIRAYIEDARARARRRCRL